MTVGEPAPQELQEQQEQKEQQTSAAPSGAAPPLPPAVKTKLTGREFWESIGAPRTIVAPMVEQSEFAWRILSRRHSPPNTLCYTPMFHSRLFASTPTYRAQSFQPPHLDGNPAHDRPTFVQFCSNDPQDLLAAARHVAPHCDAVDLNLGCPQGIARKGHYGAFLQDEWPLVHSLIRTLRDGLDVPVTAKIRILDTRERTLAYARMVVDAGASVLTVHGRTREQKGHNTGMADWGAIRHLREQLPRDVVLLANGNVLWQEDVARCLAATGADGVMSAEGNLHNPAVFQTAAAAGWDSRFPRMDRVGREYLDIVREMVLPPLGLDALWAEQPMSKRTRKRFEVLMADPSLTPIKSHLFKLWHSALPRHTRVRDLLARSGARVGEDPLASFEETLKELEKVIAEELERNPEPVDAEGKWVGPDTPVEEAAAAGEGVLVELEDGRKVRRAVPWYRCQPYYRPLPEEALAKGALQLKKKSKNKNKANAEGRDEEDEGENSNKKKKVKVNPEVEPAAAAAAEAAESNKKAQVDPKVESAAAAVGAPSGEEVCG
ncbi:dihydrouridine synthase-domain-containing protein [Morchella snyderi]|nr:dihydrouridine synthase-domain-containing protein [Morchella snyderi]